MGKRRLLMIILAAALILSASIFYYVSKERDIRAASESTAGSSELKDVITIEDIDTRLLELGGSTKSISDYSEGILFINFWATWCYYCELEMPDLIKLSELVGKDGSGKVIAIDVNEKEKTV
ncbi:MAG TPA: TlpA disulfide reductase family protein, partial [Bacillota bacterium]|nr:TlpA disulfide reductase family protein [Bacillota bacterium]